MVLTPPSQQNFLVATRRAVDANHKQFFIDNDWRMITPKAGRFVNLQARKAVAAESYYVRPMACFVPHLLIEGHIPTCPRCNNKKYVDTMSAKWISTPKTLFVMDSHHYLDCNLATGDNIVPCYRLSRQPQSRTLLQVTL